MSGSRKIQVLKRDGTIEAFDCRKLAASICRTMSRKTVNYEHAARLSEAVETYICRKGDHCLSSSAIFEMTLKALKYVGLTTAADRAEHYRAWRSMLRGQLRIEHEQGRLTLWDKGWLLEFARRSWHISPETARIFAGKIELELLRSGESIVARQQVVHMLNRSVAEYGLADAVPAGR